MKVSNKVKTVKYERIPFYVDVPDAVSEENMEAMAEWCKGEIRTEGSGKNARQYIKVHVHNPMKERQTKAFIGDRILFAGNGFKVYTPQAFGKSFRKVKTLNRREAQRAGIRPPIEGRTPVAKGTPNPKSFADQQKVKVKQKNSDVTATVPAKELQGQRVSQPTIDEAHRFTPEQISDVLNPMFDGDPGTLPEKTIAQQQDDYAKSVDEQDQKTAEEMLAELLEDTN